eukprot:3700786-Amphidinium_carterae.1
MARVFPLVLAPPVWSHLGLVRTVFVSSRMVRVNQRSRGLDWWCPLVLTPEMAPGRCLGMLSSSSVGWGDSVAACGQPRPSCNTLVQAIAWEGVSGQSWTCFSRAVLSNLADEPSRGAVLESAA